MKTSALLFLLFAFTVSVVAQTRESPNLRNSAGERTGRWTIYFDDSWKVTEDTSNATFYRIITYENGKPAGITRDYYMSGKLQGEERILTEDPETFDGPVVGYYENGNKQFEQQWISGKIEGVSRAWYPSGALHMEMTWKHGKLHGPATGWHESGTKEGSVEYVEGMKQGIQRQWDPSGKLRTELPFVDDKPHGEQKMWDEKGELTTVIWDHGVKKEK